MYERKAMEMDELLAWLRERMDDGEYATAETFLNDLVGKLGAANEYRESSEARMSEYAANEEAMKADIQSLKARNYDLLMQVPAEGAENDGDGIVVEDVDEDGTVYHIDNLFTDDKEDDEIGN